MRYQKFYLKFIIVFLINVVFFAGFNFAYAKIDERELGDLLNQERNVYNLKELNFDFKLYQAAQNKAHDMIKNDYFEHYSPQGKSPWDFILASGYDYKIAGENLAMDFSYSQSIHDAWMSSYTHKENILNPSFEDFAIVQLSGKINNKNTIVVVEMFGKKDHAFSGKINGLFTTVSNYLLGYQNLFR